MVDAPFQHDYDISLIEHLPKIHYPLGPAFVNSCNGLFLLVFPSDKIVLWNPTIRDQSRRIPSPILKRRDRWRCYAIYGFGYVCSMDDYKIVRLGCKGHSNDYDFEIFSTRSNSWNLIRKFSPADYFSARDFVFVDGIVYMMVVNDLLKTSNQLNVYIEYFCLENEQFGELLFQLQRKDDPVLHTLGENLCLIRLVHHDSMPNFEVWRMTKNGKSPSWSKILSLRRWEDNLRTYRIRPVSFMKDGDVLFLMDRTKFVVYNSSIHRFEEVKVVGRETSSPFSWIVTYVETLFSPN